MSGYGHCSASRAKSRSGWLLVFPYVGEAGILGIIGTLGIVQLAAVFPLFPLFPVERVSPVGWEYWDADDMCQNDRRGKPDEILLMPSFSFALNKAFFA